MTNSVFRKISTAAVLAASMMLPAVASAAPVIFSLTGAPVQSAPSGNFITQTVATPNGPVKVRVSAWSLTGTSGGGTINKSSLGVYSSGLGATSGDENGGGNTHTLDNQNRRDFLVFQFDQSVKLINGLFSPFALNGFGKDTDFTVGAGNSSMPWNVQPGLNGQSYAALTTLFSGGLASYTGANVNNTKALNPSAIDGNTWLVGASFHNPDRTLDSFKFSKLTVEARAVPESATWMMMIVGFGGIGATMRRKTAAVRAAA